MAHITWLKSFETGITSIDDDHKDLVATIGKIQDELADGDMVASLALFQTFIDQAADHFKREEAFLRAIYFPRLESHASAHNELLRRCRETMAELALNSDADGGAKALEDMIYFLLEDIIKADAEFKSHAQELGAK